MDFNAANASRLIGSSRSTDVTRWLFDRAGDDSNREGTYHITKAYKIGDLERIRTLAAAPGFDVNRGWLLPMPGCGDDVVPYTTEAERSKLNEQMATTYRRVSSTRCTMLVYPLESALFHQDPFQPEVATYLIEELGTSMEILLEAGCDKWATPFANAVSLGRMKVVKFLVWKGAEAPLESRGKEVVRCILNAASDSATETLQYLLGDVDRVKCFDLTCKDKFGETPLNLACLLRHQANVKFLLQHVGSGEVVSTNHISAAC